jgi:hypothetical protein
MKTFYGEASIVARICYGIEAENEEEAKEKLFNANLPLDLVDDEGKQVCEIAEVNWHMVDQTQRGNIQESDLSDFYIEEEN